MDEKSSQDAEIPDLISQSEAEGADDSISVAESTSTTMSSPGRKHLMKAVASSLQSMDPMSLLKPVQQAIHCTGDDNQSSFSIYGNDVTIFPCENVESHKIASSKVKISQVCKYDWEQKYNFGDLVASNKTYVAYILEASNKKNEHVRVINHKTSSRVLLKGFEGKVTSIVFGGPDGNHLACMDMIGNIRVFLLSESDGELKFEKLAEYLRKDMYKTEFSLVSWAPSLLADEESDMEDNSDLILAITHEKKVDVLSLRQVLAEGKDDCLIENITVGRKAIYDGHTKPITQLIISPNFEVLATSSLDGYVKMWNINFENEEQPRCLHDWQPHDGEPVSALFFCDNHLAQDENFSSWRFLITGAKYNSEIKVWCSVTWKCLQVLRFCESPQFPPSDEPNPWPRLKPALDKSASFFILSDIERQVLYVLQLFQDAQEGTAHFTSLTECILTQPMLSFSLYQSHGVKKIGEEAGDENEEDDGKDVSDFDQNGLHEHDINNGDYSAADSERSAYQVSLRMFGIHTRSLDKLHIRYTPSCSVRPPTPSVCTAVSSEDHMSIKDAMSDITESHASVLSDHEEADSFATMNLKVSVADESIKSSSSTLTMVSAEGSSLAVENESNIGAEAESEKAEENMTSAPAKEETVDSGEIVKTEIKVVDQLMPEESPVDESPVKESPSEIPERLPPVEESPMRQPPKEVKQAKETLPGKVTILKRPDKFTKPAQDESKPAIVNKVESENSKTKNRSQKKKAFDNEAGKKKLLADSEIKSLERSKTPPEGVTPRNMESAEEKGSFELSGSVVMGSSVNSKTSVEIGDLLGLDTNTAAVGEEKRPIYQENLQPTGLILRMMQDQQKNISQLTEAVQNLTSKLHEQTKINEKLTKQQNEERENIKSVLNSMQKNTTSALNKLSKDVSKVYSQRIDSLASTVQSSMQQTMDDQVQLMFHGIISTIGGKLEKAVKSEFKASAMPSMQKMINTVMDQVLGQVSTRLAAVEKVVLENVAAIVKSKAMAETIGFNAATVLDKILPNTYRESFEKILIPSYEKSCREMFIQISKEFEKGTRNYFQRMDGYFKQRQSEERDSGFQEWSRTFQDTADRLMGIEQNLGSLMQKQISDVMYSFKDDFVTSSEKKFSQIVSDSLKEVIGTSMSQMKNELADVIGGAAAQESSTSVTTENKLQRIDRYLKDCDYSKAFDDALNAEDLSFVLHVCKRVDSEDLFSRKGSNLAQPTILALIQQLSVDLTNETELKVNYLSEAIEALDEKDEITSIYMPTVLESLLEQVENAIAVMKSSDEPDKQHQQQLSMLRKLIRAKHR